MPAMYTLFHTDVRLVEPAPQLAAPTVTML